MKETELINLRGKREKHFLQEDGTIVAKMYGTDIHYKKNGVFEEIDNTLIKEDEYYYNKDNSYHIYFKENTLNGLNKMQLKNKFLNFELKNCNNVKINIVDTDSKISSIAKYENIFDGIDIEYNILPTKVKENIIIKNKESLVDEITFIVKTDYSLNIDENNNVEIIENDEIISKMEAPYIIDSNGNVLNCVCYNLIKLDDCYELKIIIDNHLFQDETIKYPIIIDPTISSGGINSVADTYIYQGDTGVNKGNLAYVKAGVERINNTDIINRSLIKFDLPTIGTGSQIINAELELTPYIISGDVYDNEIICIHRVTHEWTESNANWNSMNDKYDSRVEGIMNTPYITFSVITDLVRKWYSDYPNNGIMLKNNSEVYTGNGVPKFWTKDGDSDYRPYLIISYRNQNGIENYMDYKTQTYSIGNTYLNSYNGNLCGIFDIGNTINGKLPASLKLVYNTNDVVLNNNLGYGKGFRLNLSQIIKKETLDGIIYLSYVDEDGTIHYFRKYGTDTIYKDEDGLNMTIEETSTQYILKDKDGNKIVFIISNNIGYLKEIVDVSNNKIIVDYNNNNTISKITDANLNEITLSYTTNEITINSPADVIHLYYSNNKITSIETKTGITYFNYDSNNLITSITDETGLKNQFEYYSQSPYRIKKISEYGIDNTIGNYFNVTYNFRSTTIVDNKNRVNTMTFNDYGNVSSISNLKSREDINNAYGRMEYSGESIDNNTYNKYKNKLINMDLPNKYVKNYLSNSSFEANSLNFTPSDSVTQTISTDTAETGKKSLKVVNTAINKYIRQTVSITKGKYYTFSAYIKNTGKVSIALSYTNSDNEIIEEKEEVIASSSFERSDVTIYYSEDASSNLTLSIYFDEIGISYIDDVQLEEGEVANTYNMLENSDFSNGLTDWTLSARNLDGSSAPTTNLFNVVTLNNGSKALQIKMNPKYTTSATKDFDIKGTQGDTYNISFWYKNEGLHAKSPITANYVVINYDEGDEWGHCEVGSIPFNVNPNEWQYFTASFTAERDFRALQLKFNQYGNANNLYITNLYMTKDYRKLSFDYDENGNPILAKDLNNELTNFSYDKNNQLIQMMNPKGNKFKFEYDNIVTDRVINGISESGISNKIKYDENGNPILTKIIHNDKEIVNGRYRIRIKGTSKYLRLDKDELIITDSNCEHNDWIIDKNDNVYYVHHPVLTNLYFSNNNDNLILSNNEISFTLTKNTNGSYLIKQNNTNKYLKVNNDNIIFSNYVENNSNFEFYIESTEDEKIIENDATYTSDGRFINSVTDSMCNETKYEYYENNGLIKSITNPKNIKTEYRYDELDRMTFVDESNKSIEFEYNSNNTLSKSIFNDKEYSFEYDSFLNTKKIKINNNVFVNNIFDDNNGNIIESQYGNNHIIKYRYDELDRLNKIIKTNNTYNFKYDCHGNLSKIISNDDITKYTYDSSNKLREYRFNDYKIKYNYDENGNIIDKKYILDENIHIINNIYNSNDIITKVIIDSEEFNYEYDSLDRLIRTRNNTFGYKNKGNRTSLLISSLQNVLGNYRYEYDSLNNITNIYNNNNLVLDYYYDNYNQLIEENNYILGQTIKYVYDDSGNILSKKVFSLNTENLLYQNTYEYNNLNWSDQLTKFNNIEILYDEIGNPINIGNDILTWVNGKQLQSYNNIQYMYNKNGIRIGKEANGNITKYYLEGDRVILEKRNNNVIYYLYDDVQNLIGLKCNGNTYYYIKNIQEDIIGIINNSNDIIAKYEYDSWGNILSIKDNNDDDITDLNHIARINPFRYRSYYYDEDTNFYYLNSRYYNPAIGRFISPDCIIGNEDKPLAYNLYIYANNNPINNVDDTGQFSISLALTGGVALILLSAAVIPQAQKSMSSALTNIISNVSSTLKNNISITTSSNKDYVKEQKMRLNERAKFLSLSLATVKSVTREKNYSTYKPCTPAILNKVTNDVDRINKRMTTYDSYKYVQKGGNVFCDDEFSAREVAQYFKNYIGPEIDKYQKPGYKYYPHFHPDRYSHRHIWFYN